MKKSLRVLSVTLAGAMLLSTSALACTGVYVGKDVSDQGTYLIARSEDQGQGDYNKMFQVQPRVENVPGRFITDTSFSRGFRIAASSTSPPVRRAMRLILPAGIRLSARATSIAAQVIPTSQCRISSSIAPTSPPP